MLLSQETTKTHRGTLICAHAHTHTHTHTYTHTHTEGHWKAESQRMERLPGK